MTDEILPCPFCGAPGEAERSHAEEDKTIYVKCAKYACGGFKWVELETWNTRAPLDMASVVRKLYSRLEAIAKPPLAQWKALDWLETQAVLKQFLKELKKDYEGDQLKCEGCGVIANHAAMVTGAEGDSFCGTCAAAAVDLWHREKQPAAGYQERIRCDHCNTEWDARTGSDPCPVCEAEKDGGDSKATDALRLFDAHFDKLGLYAGADDWVVAMLDFRADLKMFKENE